MSRPADEEAATLPPAAPAKPGEVPTLAPEELIPEVLPADRISIPGYEVLGEVARGGMGVVYKARQTGLNRLVALKMVLAGAHAGADDLARFRTEAEAVARLQHPHIVQIYEIGAHDGCPYFSMEFVDGGSLADRLDGTPWPPRKAAVLTELLARAIHAAHEKGVVHRDLKPGNILLQKKPGARSQESEGRGEPAHSSLPSDSWLLAPDFSPKITDFGLAKQLDHEHGQTRTGSILGTPSYMAPEQAGGRTKEVGPLADVYALGAIFYELLTGRPPFRAETPLDTLLQVVSNDAVAPRLLQPQLPLDLETITLKCLQKDAARRYDSAEALAEDLRRFLHDEPIRARRPSLAEQGLRWVRKHRRAAVLTMVTAVVSAVVVVAGLFAAAAYAERFHGSLELTTGGPALFGDVFNELDGGLASRITVPTARPEALWAGDYRLRLTKPGRVSETYRLRVEERGEHHFAVSLTDREMMPPVEIPGGPTLIELLPQPGGGSDLVLVQEAYRVRCLDVAAGRLAWEFVMDVEGHPPGRNAAEWSGLLRKQDDRDAPQLVRPAPDLDGDGRGDLVWAARTTPSLLAQSRDGGRTLWWYRARPPLPAGTDPARARFAPADAQLGTSRIAGRPLLVPGNRKPPEFILTCTSRGENFYPEDPPRQPASTGPVRWLERVAAGAERPAWQYRLDPRWFRDADNAPLHPATLVELDGRPLIVVAAGTHLVGLDLDGRPAWPPLSLDIAPAVPPQFADVDGDGVPEILMADETGWRLTALRLGNRVKLWQAGRIDDDVRGVQVEPDLREAVVTEPGPDGSRDLILPCTCKRVRGQDWLGIEVRRGSDGQRRWYAPLTQVQDAARDRLRLRWASGPDLDGDGLSEVFAAAVDNNILTGNAEVLTVYALSGADGATLWYRRHELAHAPSVLESPRWWQPGRDGYPQLMVPVGPPSPLVRQSDTDGTYVFECSTGELAHLIPGMTRPDVADLDGDGLLDLYYSYTPGADSRGEDTVPGEAIPARPTELHAARGLPPEEWRWLGLWHVAQDYDGDGVPDVLRRRQNLLVAASGRDGRVLWPRSWYERLDDPIAPGPARVAGILAGLGVAAPSLPHGDLDADGWPDLLVRGKQNVYHPVHTGRIRLPLTAYSGRDGRLLWHAEDVVLPEGIPWHHDYSMLDLPLCHDLDGDGTPEVIVPQTRSAPERSSWLTVLDNRLRPRWDRRLHEASWESPRDLPPPPTVVADLGNGAPSLLVWVPVWRKQGQPTVGLELHAYRGRDGERLWRHTSDLSAQPLVNWEIGLAPPAVGDLDGDGTAEVMYLDVRHVVALDGSSGKERWRRAVPNRLPGFSRGTGMAPVLILRRRVGSVVALSTQGVQPVQLILFDARGEPAPPRPLRPADPRADSVALWRYDVDGDGEDELLLAADGKVRACRGGIEPKDEVWAWPPGKGEEDLAIVDVLPRRPDRPAIVVVRTGRRGALLGLDAASGAKVLWRGWVAGGPEVAGAASIAVDGSGPLPRIVDGRPGQGTVCRSALPANAAGLYEPKAMTRVVLPASRPTPQEPWRLRPLPWADGVSLSWRTLLACFALLLLVPGALLRWAIREKSWKLGLLTAAWLATGVLVLWYWSRFDPLKLGNAPGSIYVPAFAAAALAGFAAVLVPARLVVWSYRRRVGRVLALLGVFALAAAAIAALALVDDSPKVEPWQHYSWQGWYYLLPWANLAAGTVLLAWALLNLAGRLFRRGVRRLLRRHSPRPATV